MQFIKKPFQTVCCFLIAALLISMLSATAFAEETDTVAEVPQEQPETAVAEQNTILYLKPNDNWVSENAWFVLYYFDFDDHYDCVAMTDEDGDGIYEAMLPEGYPNFLFYRVDATAAEFSGDYVLHQTDCFEYTEAYHCYVLAEGSWESGIWEAAPAEMAAAADEPASTEEAAVTEEEEETSDTETMDVIS